MPSKKEDIPSAIERSAKHAQHIYKKALKSAHKQYDSEARAHRVAYGALKHEYKKSGDHWVKK